MPLDSSFPQSLKRFAVAHAQNPRAFFETVLFLPLSPLGSPFHRPSLNLAGANPRQRFSLLPLSSLSLSSSLAPRPDALNIFFQPTYIKFLRFFELYLSRFASSSLLSLASCLFPSLATRDGARDPRDNPVYLSDKRPINLFALSPTPLPLNPRPPRAH